MPTKTLAKTTRQIAAKAPSRNSRSSDLAKAAKRLEEAQKAVQALLARHAKGDRGKTMDKAIEATMELCDDASSELFSARHPEG